MNLINFSKIILLLIFINLNVNVYGIINHATVWKRFDQTLQRDVYVITCDDVHSHFLFNNQYNVNPQIRAIKNLINKSDESTLFLVEDMSFYEGDNKLIRESLPKDVGYLESSNDTASVLLGLSDFILKCKKNVKNVECRFYVNALQNIASFVASHMATDIWRISYQEIVNNFKKTNESFENIAKFLKDPNDLAIYRKFYNGIMDAAKESLQAIEEFSDETSIETLIANEDKTFFEVFNKSRLVCFRILDIKVINEILKNKFVDKFFIFMGGAHIYNINLVLEELGFVKELEEGQILFKDRFDGQPIFTSDLFSPCRNIERDFKDSSQLLEELKSELHQFKILQPEFFENCQTRFFNH